MEKNEQELAGFPYSTYFVTSYLADDLEAQEHEKILKEQLLKDFESMGDDELDLVDTSYHLHAKHFARKAQIAVNERGNKTEVESLIKSSLQEDLWRPEEAEQEEEVGASECPDIVGQPAIQAKDNVETSSQNIAQLKSSSNEANRPTLSESLATSKDLTSLFMDVRGESPRYTLA